MLQARVPLLLLILILSGLISMAVPRPEPNGRVRLYLMGQPTPTRMRVAAISEIVEVEPIGDAIRELKRSGARPILYDWLFARYEWEAGDWNESLFLVRFDGPYGPALAYDYGSEEVRSLRAKELIDRMVRYGYEGVFFDWFPVACDPDIAEEESPGYVEEFRRRHPGESLQEALLSFIGELREEGERRGLRVFIVSNQAYRCGPRVMASVDWDISESYFTDVRNGTTVFFPWEAGNWESPAAYVPELVESVYEEAKRINFRLGFTHVSYALPGDEDASFYAFAGAMTFGHDGIALTPSELEGEVLSDGVPNAYWLGCFRYRINSSHWALAVYDLGVVAAGQVPIEVPGELRGAEVYDLREGRVRRLDVVGRNGPWGDVFLRLPARSGVLSCPGERLEVSLWSDLVEGALETLASLGKCSLRVKELSQAERVESWSWREASREVVVVANDIDWRMSGLLLEKRLKEEGIQVSRAPLSFQGLREALLDSKVLIVLGGRRSLVTGPLMEPVTSRLDGWEGRLGPGRLVMWLWGEDRYGTREATLSHLEGVVSEVKNVLSPLPRCPSGDRLRTGGG